MKPENKKVKPSEAEINEKNEKVLSETLKKLQNSEISESEAAIILRKAFESNERKK